MSTDRTRQLGCNPLSNQIKQIKYAPNDPAFSFLFDARFPIFPLRRACRASCPALRDAGWNSFSFFSLVAADAVFALGVFAGAIEFGTMVLREANLSCRPQVKMTGMRIWALVVLWQKGMIVGQDRKKSVRRLAISVCADQLASPGGSTPFCLDSMSTKENDRNSSAQETLNSAWRYTPDESRGRD